jgi:16S rRNA (cytidine1402-2'-O)-methyltransferase
LEELAARFAAHEPKGELVVLVEGHAAEQKWAEPRVREALAAGLQRGERLKPLTKELAALSGWSAGDLYELGLKVK